MFGNVWPSSDIMSHVIFENPGNSQDKNLMPLSQKKLTGACILSILTFHKLLDSQSLKMTSTQVFKTTVSLTLNSLSQDYTHPDDHNLHTYDMILRVQTIYFGLQIISQLALVKLSGQT